MRTALIGLGAVLACACAPALEEGACENVPGACCPVGRPIFLGEVFLPGSSTVACADERCLALYSDVRGSQVRARTFSPRDPDSAMPVALMGVTSGDDVFVQTTPGGWVATINSDAIGINCTVDRTHFVWFAADGSWESTRTLPDCVDGCGSPGGARLVASGGALHAVWASHMSFDAACPPRTIQYARIDPASPTRGLFPPQTIADATSFTVLGTDAEVHVVTTLNDGTRVSLVRWSWRSGSDLLERVEEITEYPTAMAEDAAGNLLGLRNEWTGPVELGPSLAWRIAPGASEPSPVLEAASAHALVAAERGALAVMGADDENGVRRTWAARLDERGAPLAAPRLFRDADGFVASAARWGPDEYVVVAKEDNEFGSGMFARRVACIPP